MVLLMVNSVGPTSSTSPAKTSAPADHFAQALHAAVDADVGAETEDHRRQQDHRRLHHEIVGDAGQRRQPASKGGGGQHQRNGEGADGGDQENQIHHPPNRAVGAHAGDGGNDPRQAEPFVLTHVEVVGHDQRGEA